MFTEVNFENEQFDKVVFPDLFKIKWVENHINREPRAKGPSH